jgi:TolB protein
MESYGLTLQHFFSRTRQALLLLTSGLLMASAAQAQFRVEVTGVGLNQIPIAFAQFRGEASAPQNISAIVQSDLLRSGQFKALTAAVVVDETERPNMEAIRGLGADAFLAGSVKTLPDGRFEVRFRLWDAVKNEDLGATSYVVEQKELRLAAHRISDFVYENLTAEKGIFSTRIAFVTKANDTYDLWVSDIDGENAKSALTSPEPIISPTWSPDGSQLAYVSFESRKPVVYIHNISKATRRIVANFKGSNSAPAWSPDGKTLVVALTTQGNHQLFALTLPDGKPRRLTQSLNTDTEPVFSHDGKLLYFVSDRGGNAQIYRYNLASGATDRVTFVGDYNISPAISPDGKMLAYISRIAGAYKLQVMNLETTAIQSLTDTRADERPSFAPNGRLIVYATQEAGRDALMTVTLDGRIKTKLAAQQGDMREPFWGPYLTPR